MTKNSMDSEPKKRALISLPFIAICLVVLGIGLFRGEWIMVQLMYWQEHYVGSQEKSDFGLGKIQSWRTKRPE